jgi:hypothetical protein
VELLKYTINFTVFTQTNFNEQIYVPGHLFTGKKGNSYIQCEVWTFASKSVIGKLTQH